MCYTNAFFIPFVVFLLIRNSMYHMLLCSVSLLYVYVFSKMTWFNSYSHLYQSYDIPSYYSQFSNSLLAGCAFLWQWCLIQGLFLLFTFLLFYCLRRYCKSCWHWRRSFDLKSYIKACETLCVILFITISSDSEATC